MTNKKENLKLLISLGLAGVMVAIIFWLINKLSSTIISSNTEQPSSIELTKKSSFINWGTKISVKARTSQEKRDGVKAFAEKNFSTAVEQFTASLIKNPNDPETLIYLNNAKIALDNSENLKVAVIAPVSLDQDLAEELLRGVAQAQNEINNQGGINGKKLQIAITSVENREDFKKLDQELVEDQSFVAAVGSRPDAAIYNEKGLVLVFPIERPNQAENPENIEQNAVNNQPNTAKNNYLFHVNPLYDNLVETHANYIGRKGINIAICGDIRRSGNNSNSSSNPVLVEQYTKAIEKYGGKVISTSCNLADNNFVPKAFVDQAIEKENASGFLLIPSLRNKGISSATKVAQEIKGRKPLFGSETMYSPKTLENGKDVEGMIVPVYWHRDKNKQFAKKALELWKAPVNQRTAGAYDAMRVIIAGLKKDNTREGLQKVLSNPDFSTSGATGDIKFSPLGRREGEAFLVRIERCERCSSGTKYDFVLFK